MASVDGGALVVRVLTAAGISQVFALHGGHIDPIFQACLDQNVRVVDFRHEQAAGHAAAAFFRVTGRPAVCLVTAGPGVTNVASAVANAYLDCVPLVVIAGKVAVADEDRLTLQDMDQLGLMRPITKWCRRVTETARIPEYVSAALREAVAGRPGPVFLEIPLDVVYGRVEEDRVSPAGAGRIEARTAPSQGAVEELSRSLREAEAPLCLAGSGVWLSQACAELRELAELLELPVLTNNMGRGAMPETHPLFVGSFGLLMETTFSRVAAEADLVIVLGARMGLFLNGGRALPARARIVQVDIAGGEIGRNRRVDLGIVGDLKETLARTIENARGKPTKKRAAWVEKLQGVKWKIAESLARLASSDSVPIHPFRLAAEVVAAAGPEAVIVADGGDISSWMAAAALVEQPGGWLSHGYLGCLGTGLPFALGAKLARPEKRVVCVTGDGSVGLDFMEFHTALRHDLPFVTVISNDQAWGMCKRGQQLLFGPDRVIGTELGLVRYEKLVEALGGHGEFVTEPAEIAGALRRALDSGKVACVNVVTDSAPISPASYVLMGREFSLTGEPST
jgi:acetolactate synthase-1/2/3 large subunit